MRLSTLCLITALVTLGGCALSPQLVELNPRPTVPQQNIGNNTSVQISAQDQRKDEAFGTRGGIYGSTSLIRPADDLNILLLQSVQKGLQAQGFNAYNPSAEGPSLEVRLVQLSYVPESGSVVNSVEVKALIEATASNSSGDEYVGRYMTGNNYEQPITPSAERNQEMLNEVLERALTKLLTDQKMLSFLAGD